MIPLVSWLADALMLLPLWPLLYVVHAIVTAIALRAEPGLVPQNQDLTDFISRAHHILYRGVSVCCESSYSELRDEHRCSLVRHLTDEPDAG